jgi:hydroxymethylpyrimidine pyrophosphatase-like HAD family hydrolase
VEVINERFSKGTAVQFIADYYGIPLEKTIGVGDQQNDIPMLQTAGLGIAVQNADNGLKAVADYVTSATFDENAIAEVIEKFGFIEE